MGWLKQVVTSPFTGRKMVWGNIYDRLQKKLVGVEKSDWPSYFDYQLNSIIGALYKQLSETDPSEFDVLNQYIQLLNYLRQIPGECVGLELGSGVSTVLLGKLISERGGILYSVDYDRERMPRLLGGATVRHLSKYVRFLTGSTVTAESLKTVYFDEQYRSASTLANITPSSLQRFIREYRGNYHELLPRARRDSVAEISQLFFRNGSFTVPVEILNRDRLLDEINRVAAQDVTGVLNELLEDGVLFDFVFFDSGEHSSLAEWLCLKEHVKAGGLIALHDIYYPKSAKNFIVAADVSADPKYQIAYIDQTTPQGLLIARRVHD